jgi:hypothetical protein
MLKSSLDSKQAYPWRVVALIFGGALVVLVPAMGLAQLPKLNDAVLMTAIFASLGVYIGIILLGIKHWATEAVRYELDERGLAVVRWRRGREMREQLPWSEIREYVVDSLAAAGSNRYLTVTRAGGKPVRIVEGNKPAEKDAFDVFCDHFLDAVAERQATAPAAATIHEGVSFYDKPVALVLGVVLLATMVVLAGVALFVPGKDTLLIQARVLWMGALAAPFIYRTVFHRKLAKRAAA